MFIEDTVYRVFMTMDTENRVSCYYEDDQLVLSALSLHARQSLLETFLFDGCEG